MKCNGVNPCQRCKSDDTVCIYGKRIKSDKAIYRQGYVAFHGVLLSLRELMLGRYVQMIERQNTRLVAGVQELYRRIQSKEGWTGPQLDNVDQGKPVTHQALGVLQKNGEWNDIEGSEDPPQSSGPQSPVSAPIYPFCASSVASKRGFYSSPHLASADPTIISRRLSQLVYSVPISPNVSMPLLTDSPLVAKTGLVINEIHQFPPPTPAVKEDFNLGFGHNWDISADTAQKFGMGDLFDTSAQPMSNYL